MKTLQVLGSEHGTDKGNDHHTFEGVSYLDVYSHYFDPIRDRVTQVLELGVLRGQSLKMWRDYFPSAEVWGVDINPTAVADYGPRIHVVTGSQIDRDALASAAPGQLFDVVVDDGSHLVDHILQSFELLWPRVAPGGYYVVEDLQCTYNDNTPNVHIWPGQHLNPPGTNFVNDRLKLDTLFTTIIHSLDAFTGNEFRFIHFWPKQCVIKRALFVPSRVNQAVEVS